MKINAILTSIFLLVYPNLTLAFTCAGTANNATHMRNIVQKVNIVGKDNRQYLDEFTFPPDVKNPDEIKDRLRKATGYVACENTNSNDAERPGEGSGFLINYANTIFVCTATHNISSKTGKVFDDQKCFFQNQPAENQIRVYLDLSPQQFIVPTRNARAEGDKELSCSKLNPETELPDDVRESAFTIAESSTCPVAGQTLYAISAREIGFADRAHEHMPVVRPFTAKAFGIRNGREAADFTHDGDLLGGSSGGSNFVIRGNQIEACGVSIGGASAAANGLPYNIWDPLMEKRSYGVSTKFDSRILELLSIVATGDPVRIQNKQEEIDSAPRGS